LAGFKLTPGSDVKVGGSAGICSETDQVKWDFLEFTGTGLTTLTEASKEKRDYMAALGARLLKDEPSSNETGRGCSDPQYGRERDPFQHRQQRILLWQKSGRDQTSTVEADFKGALHVKGCSLWA
jgi:Domain of unknown function (DUF4055)